MNHQSVIALEQTMVEVDHAADEFCRKNADASVIQQVDSLRRAVLDNLAYLQGRLPEVAFPRDWYMALAYSVRDRMLAHWQNTVRTYAHREVKVVCYLSAEFLIGLLDSRVIPSYSLNCAEVLRLTPPAILGASDLDWLGRALTSAASHVARVMPLAA